MTVLVPISLPSAGSISVEIRDGGAVLRLVGEVDAETVAAYERIHGPGETVVAVDLTEVRFLSSSAVSFLVRRTRAVRDHGQLPVLCGVSAHARRVLELIGAIGLFAPVS